MWIASVTNHDSAEVSFPGIHLHKCGSVDDIDGSLKTFPGIILQSGQIDHNGNFLRFSCYRMISLSKDGNISLCFHL